MVKLGPYDVLVLPDGKNKDPFIYIGLYFEILVKPDMRIIPHPELVLRLDVWLRPDYIDRDEQKKQVHESQSHGPK